MTPVNAQYSVDRWMHLHNTAIGDEAASEQIDKMFKIVFAEDKSMLESSQKEENRPQNRGRVGPLIDKGSNVCRNRIQDLV